MTTYADIDAFADELGARRRRAEEAASSLTAPVPVPDAAPAIAPSAPARATVELLAAALDDLGQAEEELRVQNEALFAARTELEAEQQEVLDFFELAPVAYIVTTADGRMLRMNQAAFALFGRPANFTVGKPLALFAAPEDRPAFRAALARACMSPHVETWRVCLLPRDGEPLECRVRVRTVNTQPQEGRHVPALYWVITPELSDQVCDVV